MASPYSGAFGNSAGDLSRVITSFAEQAKADKAARADAAYKQALLAVQQEEATARGKAHEYNVSKDTRDFDARMAADKRDAEGKRLDAQARQVEADADDLATEQWRSTQDANTDQNRAMIEALRQRGLDQGDRRADQQDVKISQSEDYTTIKGPFDDGTYLIWNPRTQTGSPAVKGEDGIVRPQHPEATQGRTVNTRTSTRTRTPVGDVDISQGMATSDPKAASAAEGLPAQAQAQTPSAPSAQTPAAKPKPGTPLKGATPQGERDKASTFGQLRTLWADINSEMGKVGHKPPGMLTQLGLDTAREGLIPGVPDAIEKIVANNAIGQFSPEYQPLEQSYNALSTFLTQMITGAQMSQAEADRIRGLVTMRSGDTPEKVQLRMKEAQGIIDAAEAKVSKRAAADMPATAEPPSAEAIAYYNSLVQKGYSPAQAEAETDEKFAQ